MEWQTVDRSSPLYQLGREFAQMLITSNIEADAENSDPVWHRMLAEGLGNALTQVVSRHDVAMAYGLAFQLARMARVLLVLYAKAIKTTPEDALQTLNLLLEKEAMGDFRDWPEGPEA